MLIIQIALGIILALLILVWFPFILGFGLLLILALIALGVLAFGFSFIPESWIQFFEDYWFYPVVAISIFGGFYNFRQWKYYRLIRRKKVLRFLTKKILFAEKIFGKNSAQNIIGFIFFIIFVILCFVLSLVSPWIIVFVPTIIMEPSIIWEMFK